MQTLIETIPYSITKLLSHPIHWVTATWRNKKMRNFIAGVIVFYLVDGMFDWGYFTIMMNLIARYGIVLPMMAGQFALMFWFLSRTKVIETVPGDEGGITFADYYGQENLVNLVRQWVGLLTDPKKLNEIGGTAISGILLTGPPGTGKTHALLTKYVPMFEESVAEQSLARIIQCAVKGLLILAGANPAW